MATHSRTLAWKIPWTEESGRLQSMGVLQSKLRNHCIVPAAGFCGHVPLLETQGLPCIQVSGTSIHHLV